MSSEERARLFEKEGNDLSCIRRQHDTIGGILGPKRREGGKDSRLVLCRRAPGRYLESKSSPFQECKKGTQAARVGGAATNS